MSDIQELIREAHVRIAWLGALRRKQMGIPLIEFATIAGVPIATLTSFEHGFGDTPANELRRIEEALAWKPGIVDRVVSAVQAGRIIYPARIVMEHLDGEDSEFYLLL